MKIILEIISIVIIISVIANIVTTKKVLTKATRFCDNQVVVGQPGADLTEKSKAAGAKFYWSDATLNIYFTGSYRPAICKITIINNVITAKQVDMPD